MVPGIVCPACRTENRKGARFCVKCGKDLKETIAYFGNKSFDDIEVTSDKLIVYKKKWGEQTGEIEVYEREKMENIEIGRTLKQLRFDYNGKRKIINFDGEHLNKIEEIFLPAESSRRREIIELAKKWGLWRFPHKHDIKALPEVLEDGEEIKRMADGFYDGTGVIVATDRRILFVNKGVLYGIKLESFPYETITSVKHKKGLALGYIKIYTGGNKAKIDNIANNEIDAFVQFIRSNIGKNTGQAPGIMDEIKKAKELLDMGAITEEEFEKIKKEYLKKIV